LKQSANAEHDFSLFYLDQRRQAAFAVAFCINRPIYPVYMIKTKVAFVEDRFLSSQSEQLKKYSKISDWLKKTGLLKKPLLFWSCKQANNNAIFRSCFFRWPPPPWKFFCRRPWARPTGRRISIRSARFYLWSDLK